MSNVSKPWESTLRGTSLSKGLINLKTHREHYSGQEMNGGSYDH